MNLKEQKKAHQFFSTECFNLIWEIIDKPKIDSEDIEKIIYLAHTSFWHWSKLPEVYDTKISVAYWMLSRVYSISRDFNNAKMYGEKYLDISLKSNLDTFFIAYAYEALA